MELSTANLQTRARRATLRSRHSYYWVGIGERGKCIGYRRARDQEPGVWYARLYAEGRWIQNRLGFTDDREDADGVRVLTLLQAKEKALTWFPTARNEAEGKVHRHGKYKVSDALVDYFADCRSRGMKPGNVYRQECASRAHIEPTLGGVPVERLTIGRIKKWMGDAAELPARKRSRKDEEIAYRDSPETEDRRRARRDTVNRVLNVLKAALNLAVSDRRVPVANAFAWREVKPFGGTEKARTLFLSSEQQRTLIAACDEDFARLARAGLYSGARYGELCQVLVRDYNKAYGSLNIAPHIAKNGKARHIHLDAEGKQFFTAVSSRRAPDEHLFLRASRKQIPEGRSPRFTDHGVRVSRLARSERRASKRSSSPSPSTPSGTVVRHGGWPPGHRWHTSQHN